MAFNFTGLQPESYLAHFVADLVKDSALTAGTYHIGPKQIPENACIISECGPQFILQSRAK